MVVIVTQIPYVQMFHSLAHIPKVPGNWNFPKQGSFQSSNFGTTLVMASILHAQDI